MTKLFLNKNAKLESHWIQGKPHIISKNEADLSGSYELFFEYQNFIFDVKDSLSKISAYFEYLDKKIPVTIQRSEKEINLRFTLDSVKYLLSGLIDTFQWNGHYLDKDGSWLSWNASKLKSNVTIKNPAAQNIELPEVFLPAYPWTFKEHKDSLLIKNACIWTSSKAGVLNEHDLIVHKGKIVKIGKGLKVKKGETIDATGKFLTAGIVDEHSHIAIRGGVNEAGLPITSMVRIKDVINAEDINIYRQLAGGVTSAQLLHGSANPIGGQSAIIKLKWGLDANKLLFKDQPKFIKFALGENVKQANFHCAPKKRYPKNKDGGRTNHVRCLL